MSTFFKIAGITLLVLTFILVLGGLWWWAILGMSKAIGTATIWTAFLLGAVGAIATVMGFEL